VQRYRAPGWLPGGQLQTVWPVLWWRARGRAFPPYRRERWSTQDDDFVDAVWLDAPSPDAPLLVLFHGLEGSSRSHYSVSFADAATRLGWRYVVPHFRGCSGELNRARRVYHSGDHAEIGWMLARCRALHRGPIVAVGISLGGNALLRWAEEPYDHAIVRAVAAVSSPLDLTAGGHALGRGFNRAVYTRMFMRSLKPKALAKIAQHPGLADADRVRASTDLYSFDDAFTAPVHGFAGVLDYWHRASAKPHLDRIGIPALLLNATNDPFVPFRSLPQAAALAARHVTIWQPAHGGHVGFPGGRFPGHLRSLPDAVTHWLAAQL
jgi:predicted alpha/beta-fold hydrolase